MQLLFAQKSPYSRRARLAVRLSGLLDRVEEINISPGPAGLAAVPWVTNYTDVTTLVDQGPAAKVPVLVTDSGVGLCESMVIAHYLNNLSDGGLYPSGANALEQELRIEGLAAALMDSLFIHARENRREITLRSEDIRDIELNRTKRLLDALNALIGDIDAHRLGGLTLACGLAYADWRHAGHKWREGRAPLAAWFKETCVMPPYAEVFDA
jgi:glutathione S-transferase